jgi:hypothetical protein
MFHWNFRKDVQFRARTTLSPTSNDQISDANSVSYCHLLKLWMVTVAVKVNQRHSSRGIADSLKFHHPQKVAFYLFSLMSRLHLQIRWLLPESTHLKTNHRGFKRGLRTWNSILKWAISIIATDWTNCVLNPSNLRKWAANFCEHIGESERDLPRNRSPKILYWIYMDKMEISRKYIQ